MSLPRSDAGAGDRPAELIAQLRLTPHPEGGHFREVYRSGTRVRRGDADRTALTTIYFLLRAGERSRWHIVSSDEVWHFYEGDGLELITFDPETRAVQPARLWRDGSGGRSVHVVPAGWWQATRPVGQYGLAGCTVGPGFEFEDFRFVADEPDHAGMFEGPLAGYRALL